MARAALLHKGAQPLRNRSLRDFPSYDQVVVYVVYVVYAVDAVAMMIHDFPHTFSEPLKAKLRATAQFSYLYAVGRIFQFLDSLARKVVATLVLDFHYPRSIHNNVAN
jgi:hypothetical protein